LSQLIVQLNELANGAGRQTLEKASQRGLIGKLIQAQQREEGAIVLQDLGLVDASQSSHDRIHQGEQQIGGRITSVASRYLDRPLQPPP
jgi:hypothetical protein